MCNKFLYHNDVCYRDNWSLDNIMSILDVYHITMSISDTTWRRAAGYRVKELTGVPRAWALFVFDWSVVSLLKPDLFL